MLTPQPPLRPWACHRSYQIPEVPFLFVEEGWVTGLHPESRHERVLVRERIPAERDEVEDEALWCDARQFGGRGEGREGVVDESAEEFR